MPHTLNKVGGIEVSGLDGLSFHDKVAAGEQVQPASVVTITQETDRIYKNSPASVNLKGLAGPVDSATVGIECSADVVYVYRGLCFTRTRTHARTLVHARTHTYVFLSFFIIMYICRYFQSRRFYADTYTPLCARALLISSYLQRLRCLESVGRKGGKDGRLWGRRVPQDGLHRARVRGKLPPIHSGFC